MLFQELFMHMTYTLSNDFNDSQRIVLAHNEFIAHNYIFLK